MDNIEKWAEAINQSMRDVPDPRTSNLQNSEQYYAVAIAIVEPAIEDAEVAEEYADFMESNGDNWAQWIQSSFGKEWGDVARFVNENGY